MILVCQYLKQNKQQKVKYNQKQKKKRSRQTNHVFYSNHIKTASSCSVKCDDQTWSFGCYLDRPREQTWHSCIPPPPILKQKHCSSLQENSAVFYLRLSYFKKQSKGQINKNKCRIVQRKSCKNLHKVGFISKILCFVFKKKKIFSITQKTKLQHFT